MRDAKKWQFVLALSLSTFAGCQSNPQVVAPGATICELLAGPVSVQPTEFLVEARFDSDGNTFASLTDARCEARSFASIDQDAPNAERSVERFRKAREAECRRIGSADLCLVSADIRARVLVRSNSNGRKQLYLKDVTWFQFVTK